MDIKEARYIMAITEHGNISKAAKAVYVSQPSLSKFLHNIEKEIGSPLFSREQNKYILWFKRSRRQGYS